MSERPAQRGLAAWLRRCDAWWLAPQPEARAGALRLLIVTFAWVYVLVRAPAFVAAARRDPATFEPVGLASLWAWFAAGPPPPIAQDLALALALLSGPWFALGVRPRVSGPLFAAALLWLTSVRNSWGMIFHTEHLTVLHVLLLAATPVASAALSRTHPGRGHDSWQAAWLVRMLGLTTVAAYAIAGVAKLRASGLGWVWSDGLRHHVAVDNLRKLELGDWYSPFGAWLVQHGELFPPLAALTLLAELLAPVALLGGTAARLWSLTMWGFHAGVFAMMAIAFPYPLLGLAFAPLLAPERLLAGPRASALLRRLGLLERGRAAD